LPRRDVNAVLLPDRTVLVSGDGLKKEDLPTATCSRRSMIRSRTPGPSARAFQVPRLYRSVALLLAEEMRIDLPALLVHGTASRAAPAAR
jgi:hypothetical protein